MISKIRKPKPSGFTILEILAALLLIGLVLPAVMQGVSLITILASDSHMKYHAMDLAESKLAEILLTEEWSSPAASGDFDEPDDEFSWVMESSNWSVSDVKQVQVSVLWTQRNRQRQIGLSTLVYDSE